MDAPGPTILVIEDEAPMRRFLRASLTGQRYRLLEARTGQDGLAQAAAKNPDLILLDLGLPDLDGVVVTRRLREWAQIPLIVVSARCGEDDQVKALDAGADDFVPKPFRAGELLARVRGALRRSAGAGGPNRRFSVGDLTVDLLRRQVFVRDNEVALTPMEYKLLATLIKHAGRVVTHAQLLREVWGPDSDDDTQCLRVFMVQLRRKVEQDPSRPFHLLTAAGVGYRLRADG